MCKIEIIIGPMFSGKSSELLRRTKRYKSINKKIFYINYHLDKRYGNNRISTHDNIFESALMANKLLPLINEVDFSESEIIAINEAQFFLTYILFV